MPSAHSKCQYVVDRSSVPEKEMKTKYEFTANHIITIDFKKSSHKIVLQIKNELLKKFSVTRYETIKKILKGISRKTGLKKKTPWIC